MIDLRFHYITQDVHGYSHEQLVQQACDAGAKLVQLRMKNYPHDIVYDTAHAAKQICDRYDAALIINDFPDVAFAVDAAGVHLGGSDMEHVKARRLIGNNKIIGGTAYNYSEASSLLEAKVVDYIGIGAFRPTATKPEISNFLTAEDLKQIAKTRSALSVDIKLIVIGGITLDDIPDIISCGVDGIAAASLVNRAEDMTSVISHIYLMLGGQHYSKF
jgi:thiamine-phosphate pyrophosphorylase